jgi:hypothetical protein
MPASSSRIPSEVVQAHRPACRTVRVAVPSSLRRNVEVLVVDREPQLHAAAGVRVGQGVGAVHPGGAEPELVASAGVDHEGASDVALFVELETALLDVPLEDVVPPITLGWSCAGEARRCQQRDQQPRHRQESDGSSFIGNPLPHAGDGRRQLSVASPPAAPRRPPCHHGCARPRRSCLAAGSLRPR